MSDLHFGKKTSTYNPDVFRQRMDALQGRLGHIRSLLSDYSFDKLVVLCLGDVNDGTDIYATQTHYQAESDVEAQASQLAEYMHGWLRRAKQTWGQVEVQAVPGNHGRVSRFAKETANWDRVAYRYLQMLSQPDGIPVTFEAEGDPFLRKVFIRAHSYLLYHGHDVKTFSSIPWYGMMLRLARWSMSALAPIDVFCMGHFHSYGDWQINQSRILATGTMVSDDEWALRTLGWESATRWHLFGVSDKRPITWQFGLDLT
jgi:predicted phosphodiesterase